MSDRHVFSPLKKPLEVEIRDDNNISTTYIIPAKEIVTYPAHIAEVVRKHIVDGIINERELGYVTPEQRKELTKETEVTLES